MEQANSSSFSKLRAAPAQLIHVVRFGTPDVLLSALQAWHRPVDELDVDGLTLFLRAIYYGRFDNADMLLSAGADVDMPAPNGWTALFWATYNQLEPAVRFLLSHGASPNIRTLDNEWPLFWAVFWGQEEIVSLLLAAGADITQVDVVGRDVTWLAKSLGHEAMVKQFSSFQQPLEVTV